VTRDRQTKDRTGIQLLFSVVGGARILLNYSFMMIIYYLLFHIYLLYVSATMFEPPTLLLLLPKTQQLL